MDLTREAIDRILDLAPPTLEVIEGRPYVNRELHAVVEPVTAGQVSVKGLAALADFLKWEYPGGCADLIANVLNEQVVLVSTRPLGPWKQRPNVAKAAFEEVTRFPFGQYVGQEAFTIGMQVGFVPDETTAKLLRLVGTIEDAKVSTLQDDGVSQKVTASVGIARVGAVTVPNPVMLRPYRTFAEVEQPSGTYIVRMKSGQGDALPTIALFEVEDPMWRRVARQSIAIYLREQVADLTVLA